MSSLSLGYQVPDYSKNGMGAMPAGPSEAQATKEDFPSLTIPGNKSLARALRVGQEFTATVKFRVSEIAIRDKDGEDDDGPCDVYGGTRVELDAQSMDIQGVTVKEGSGEADGSEAIRKFFGKKGSRPENTGSDDEGDE